jgi:hypothetical protein
MVAIYQAYYEGYPVLSSSEPCIIHGLLAKIAGLRGLSIQPLVVYTTQFEFDGPSIIKINDFLGIEMYDHDDHS